MPLHCCNYTPHSHMQDFRATCTLAPHCSLIRSVLALVGQSRLSDHLACQCSKGGECCQFGEIFGPYTKEAGYVVREACEYHSRGEEYIMCIWCYFGETCGYHSRLEGCSVCPGEACLCQLLTDNLLAVMIYNFVQKCIMLAKNNAMSVLAPI